MVCDSSRVNLYRCQNRSLVFGSLGNMNSVIMFFFLISADAALWLNPLCLNHNYGHIYFVCKRNFLFVNIL